MRRWLSITKSFEMDVIDSEGATLAEPGCNSHMTPSVLITFTSTVQKEDECMNSLLLNLGSSDTDEIRYI